MSEFDENTPKIYLDKEDKEAYLRQRNQQKSPKKETSEKPAVAAPRKSVSVLGIFTFILVLAAGGACGWLYQQSLLLNKQLADSNDRIEELEKKLSATGEEMGESTIALQAKVKQLIEKSDELWGQMDKLWASAWRRNQAEIQDLSKELKNTGKPIGDLQKKTQLLEADMGVNNTSIVAMQEQYSSLQSDMSNLKNDLEQILLSVNRNSKLASDVNSKLTNAIMNNQNMASRLNQLENQIKNLSKASTPTPAAVSQ
ncbi:hypothetical protein [Neptunicella sp. SCSIO 80796]|uniref:hypothetical protein n=1 Tax=Neptunicella plasticusilytica TaxID=3117012 RepID=UPI003A4E0065